MIVCHNPASLIYRQPIRCQVWNLTWILTWKFLCNSGPRWKDGEIWSCDQPALLHILPRCPLNQTPYLHRRLHSVKGMFGPISVTVSEMNMELQSLVRPIKAATAEGTQGTSGVKDYRDCKDKVKEFIYRQVSNIIRNKSQHLKDSRTVLWLSLPNPSKPDVKSRMKM